jgi:hypothetical protein
MLSLFLKRPTAENAKYKLRIVKQKDLSDLLNIYSNQENLEYINKDDSNGDNFYCESIDELNPKFNFWKFAYKNKWFIKLSIINKKEKKVIGLIELLYRKSYDSFNDAIILKLDLLLEKENEYIIKEILELLSEKILKNVKFKKIATKATPIMVERQKALLDLGYKLSNRILIGMDDNKEYKYYFTKNKN